MFLPIKSHSLNMRSQNSWSVNRSDFEIRMEILVPCPKFPCRFYSTLQHAFSIHCLVSTHRSVFSFLPVVIQDEVILFVMWYLVYCKTQSSCHYGIAWWRLATLSVAKFIVRSELFCLVLMKIFFFKYMKVWELLTCINRLELEPSLGVVVTCRRWVRERAEYLCLRFAKTNISFSAAFSFLSSGVQIKTSWDVCFSLLHQPQAQCQLGHSV